MREAGICLMVFYRGFVIQLRILFPDENQVSVMNCIKILRLFPDCKTPLRTKGVVFGFHGRFIKKGKS